MGENENAAIGRQFFESWNDRDFNKLASLFTDDAAITDVPSGMTVRGPDGAIQESERWAGAFPDGKIEVRSTIAGSKGVVVEAILRGTNDGPMSGPAGEIPATHKSVEMPFIIIWDVADGLVKGQRGYYDSAALMRQLGLMPEPAGATA
jgi:steroid delta-isomerase-like uncharacterized protein